MITNPEFLRNLWLEVDVKRFISMPLILLILFLLAFLLGKEEGVAIAAWYIGLLLTAFWGANMAFDSILSEIRGHTWDNQRMAAMTAWDITWGKLFGSTIYTWYGAFFCILVFFITAKGELSQILNNTLLLLLTGLFAQALGMLFALIAVRKGKKTPAERSKVSVLVYLLSMVALAVGSVMIKKDFTVLWYDYSFNSTNFALCSLIGFVGWAWMGNQRLIRAEFKMPGRIWVWMAFVLYLVVYCSGFDSKNVPYLMAAYIISGLLTYTMIFIESKNPRIYIRLLMLLKNRDWSALQYSLQCWMGTLVTAWICGMIFLSFAHAGWIAALLFLSRDVCMILYLNFKENSKRADTTAVLYLFILYAVFPYIFQELELSVINLLFLPSEDPGATWLNTSAALIECTLMYGLMRRRWHANFSSPS